MSLFEVLKVRGSLEEGPDGKPPSRRELWETISGIGAHEGEAEILLGQGFWYRLSQALKKSGEENQSFADRVRRGRISYPRYGAFYFVDENGVSGMCDFSKVIDARPLPPLEKK